jgi:hypothetical protein
VTTTAGVPPTIRLYVPFMTFQNIASAVLGITYRVYDGTKLLVVGQPAVPLKPDESLSFTPDFVPVKGKTYTLTADVNDAHGNHELRNVAIVVR